MTLRIVMLGAGGIALGCAADLAARGHSVAVWSPSGHSTTAIRATGHVVASGKVEGRFPVEAITDLQQSIRSADVVFFALPANGFRSVMEAALPALHADHLVMLNSPLSLASLILQRRLAAQGTAAPIAACPTPPLNARVTAPGHVTISGRRTTIEVGLGNARPDTLDRVRTLLGIDLVPVHGLLAVEFGNINPVAHLPNALLNLTRMERGESWYVYGGITPSVGRLTEAIDAERLAIARAFGITARTFADYLADWYDLPPGPLAGLAEAVFARGNPTPAPRTLESRYLTEDIPFGIDPLVALAALAGVEAPLLRAGQSLAHAALDLPANDLLALPGTPPGEGRAALVDLLGPTAPPPILPTRNA